MKAELALHCIVFARNTNLPVLLVQDAAVVRSVQDQLADFRKSMEADGAAQRAECRRLVSTAVRRAGWLVDEVLQVGEFLPFASIILCLVVPSCGVSPILA